MICERSLISKACTGKISDKAVTLKSEFLDIIPRYSSITADKDFNIVDDCAARCIHFIVPPGKRGATQMTQSDVNKTSSIAKVHILVEQVIRRLKTFRILATEMPISIIGQVDVMLTICGALCNFCSNEIKITKLTV